MSVQTQVKKQKAKAVVIDKNKGTDLSPKEQEKADRLVEQYKETVASTPEVEAWSWTTIVRDARRNLETKGWPKPIKPKGTVEELIFPEEISRLNSVQLANITLRFQGWYAYVTTELAYVRAEYTTLEEVFEAKLGYLAYQEARSKESKQTKDVLRSLVLQRADMKPFFKIKLQKENEVNLIEGLEAGLKIQCNALRDEQIRRMSAQKVEIGS
jgi:hypothetical protein